MCVDFDFTDKEQGTWISIMINTPPHIEYTACVSDFDIDTCWQGLLLKNVCIYNQATGKSSFILEDLLLHEENGFVFINETHLRIEKDKAFIRCIEDALYDDVSHTFPNTGVTKMYKRRKILA